MVSKKFHAHNELAKVVIEYRLRLNIFYRYINDNFIDNLYNTKILSLLREC